MAARGIRTATLAEIYARQGHLDRARAIYEELLAESPGDADLQRRLRELTAQAEEAHAATAQEARVERLKRLLSRVRARRRRLP